MITSSLPMAAVFVVVAAVVLDVVVVVVLKVSGNTSHPPCGVTSFDHFLSQYRTS